MAEYIELVDKYLITNSGEKDYNPPSYVWVDNTGKIVRCEFCKYWKRSKRDAVYGSCDRDALMRSENFFCAAGERRDGNG